MISDYLRALRERVGRDLVLMPAATGVVLDERRRLVLVKHSNHGMWVVPGGALDPGESPADGVVREVWEESGLWVEPVKLRGVYGGPQFCITYKNGDQVAYVTSVFECRPLSGRLRHDGDETLDAGWFTEEECAALEISPWSRRVLADVFQRKAEPSFAPPTWKPPAPPAP